MSSTNKHISAEAREAMERLKMEAATEMGVDLSKKGELTAAESGSVGGQMVKKMVKQYEDAHNNE